MGIFSTLTGVILKLTVSDLTNIVIQFGFVGQTGSVKLITPSLDIIMGKRLKRKLRIGAFPLFLGLGLDL
jgi:hypothetical protein